MKKVVLTITGNGTGVDISGEGFDGDNPVAIGSLPEPIVVAMATMLNAVSGLDPSGGKLGLGNTPEEAAADMARRDAILGLPVPGNDTLN